MAGGLGGGQRDASNALLRRWKDQDQEGPVRRNRGQSGAASTSYALRSGSGQRHTVTTTEITTTTRTTMRRTTLMEDGPSPSPRSAFQSGRRSRAPGGGDGGTMMEMNLVELAVSKSEAETIRESVEYLRESRLHGSDGDDGDEDDDYGDDDEASEDDGSGGETDEDSEDHIDSGSSTGDDEDANGADDRLPITVSGKFRERTPGRKRRLRSRPRDGDANDMEADPYTLITILVIWSLLMFYLVQTRYIGRLLIDVMRPLLILGILPLVAAVALLYYQLGPRAKRRGRASGLRSAAESYEDGSDDSSSSSSDEDGDGRRRRRRERDAYGPLGRRRGPLSREQRQKEMELLRWRSRRMKFLKPLPLGDM